MTQSKHPQTQHDHGAVPEEPAREQGTWIVRRPRRRGGRSVQADLPLDDNAFGGSTADAGGDINPDDLTDEQFRQLLDGDDDIELDDLASVEDDQPMTEQERAALDKALQELVRALEETIDDMFPDDEDADDQQRRPR